VAVSSGPGIIAPERAIIKEDKNIVKYSCMVYTIFFLILREADIFELTIP
jgi:hypothetical protein